MLAEDLTELVYRRTIYVSFYMTLNQSWFPHNVTVKINLAAKTHLGQINVQVTLIFHCVTLYFVLQNSSVLMHLNRFTPTLGLSYYDH